MPETERIVVARWKSRGGKYWVELYVTNDGYSYKGAGCGGFFGRVTKDEAVAMIEERLPDFQADANTLPMVRVY